MKALFTKYIGPRNVKGSRVKATDRDGNNVTLGWDDTLSSEQNHRSAAIALCEKMGWDGTLVEGGIAKPGQGNVYVWLDDRAVVNVPKRERGVA